jgi:hypothetical protein
MFSAEPSACADLEATQELLHVVAAVLERTRDRMTKYLRRRGLLEQDDDAEERDGLAELAASAV